MNYLNYANNFKLHIHFCQCILTLDGEPKQNPIETRICPPI